MNLVANSNILSLHRRSSTFYNNNWLSVETGGSEKESSGVIVLVGNDLSSIDFFWNVPLLLLVSHWVGYEISHIILACFGTVERIVGSDT